MKRSLFVLGLAALVARPAAGQWLGSPMWNSPKGGTGVTISADYGKPNTEYGKGNAWGGRASLGLGTLTLTAGVTSWKPDSALESITTYGGNAAVRVIGGSLLPIAVNLQVGAARSNTSDLGDPETIVTGAVGLAVTLPTPGVSIEPYVSPGIRYRNYGTGNGHDTDFGFVVGANISFGMFGLHAAYDHEKVQTGGQTGSVFGIGAHVGLHLPLGM
jgi:predicted porin